MHMSTVHCPLCLSSFLKAINSKLIQNTSIANKRAVFARLGVMMPLPKGHLEERKNSTNIEIVVSHCEEHVDWIAKYVGEEFNVKQITIISKCGKSVRGLEQLSKFAHTQVVRLKNLGRCDHSYAYWIKNNYKRIEANVDAVGEDIIIFLKDNKRFRRSYYHFDKFFTFLTDAGFGCIKKPECDCSNRCLRWRYIPMMSHNKSFVLDFSLEEYKRVRRDDNAAFLNEKYKNLKSWKEDMNIVLPESPSFPICYGGMFGLRKKYILNQPFSVWGNITKSLERGDNIIEGHYAERMWAGMLSDHNKVDTRVLDEVLGPTIRDMVPRHEDDHVCGMQGMYYVRRMKNMTALFEEKIKNYTTY